MKKSLAILLFAWAIVSSASAVPVWTVEVAYHSGTGIISVSITDNDGLAYIGIAVTDGDGVLSDFAKGADAPAMGPEMFATLGAGLDYEGYGEGELWIIANTAEPVYTDGEWLKATCTPGTTDSTVTVWSFAETGDVFTLMGTIDIPAVPEPITMSLLGLGGLFLRRRK